ncbi:G patch domain-containing protein 4 [Lobulomyces angularis]|nr:G patch domain-containing protein 4 [Lobulomyces angularis]
MSVFAKNEMLKYGWQDGTGLGAKQDGIKKAVKVDFKNDTKGVGNKDDWSYAWWDHAFNKASSNIIIEKDDTGDIKINAKVKRIKKEEMTIAEVKNEKQNFLYSSFVKSKTAAEIEETEKDYSIKVSDKELLEACEGRTARKGARVEQVEKIRRVEVFGELDNNVNADIKEGETKLSLKRKTVENDDIDEKLITTGML